MTTLARVAQLWVFPVKSMAGAAVDSADVGPAGLAGDRSWAVVDRTGQPVTAAAEPRLREVVPRIEHRDLRLDVPGAPPGLEVESAAEALSDWLGRPLHLAFRDDGGFVDVAPLHVVSTASTADAQHAEECDTCDVAAPRANLVLDLEPGTGSERDWVGRSLRAGTATLSVVRLPKHCLGVYAEVTVPGSVRVGDVVSAD